MNIEALTQPTDYVSALGLQQDPFENTLADHFFYADPGLMQRLDLLQHLTQFGDQLLLIAGPEGSGKSTLLSQFRLRAKDSWKICQLDAGHIQSAGQLLHELADFYGTPYGDDNASMGRELIQHAKSLQQDAGLAIIVIDDAEQLTDECLRALLTLDESPQEALRFLRMILLGDPALESRLMTLGLNNPRKPIIHRLDMQPFDTQQSAAYLMYRLAIAGYSGDSPFSSTEVEAMHKAADGLPGRLNEFARETLTENIQRKLAAKKTAREKPVKPTASKITDQVWKKLPPPVIGAGALVLAAGIIWFSGLLDRDEDLPVDLEMQPLQLPDEVQPVIVDETTTAESEAEIATAPIVRSPPEKRIKNMVEPTITVKPAVPGTPETKQPEQTTAEPAAIPDTPVPETQTTTEAAATTTPEPPQDENVSTLQTELDKELAAIRKQPETEAEPAPEPPPVAAAEPDLPDWVARAPAEHYTLQLVGLSKRKSAEAYLEQHNLTGKAAIITSERKDGSPWFSIIFGDYPDKDTAKAATLPASLKSVQPWPRTFAAVREAAKP